ncbi:hypothetical protein [Bartonella sp. DGB2]|uniref:hypothetical protein n=2 Tax=Bartonella sp. DGB2 TaxID=3388426 RepID=UPI00398F9CE6
METSGYIKFPEWVDDDTAIEIIAYGAGGNGGDGDYYYEHNWLSSNEYRAGGGGGGGGGGRSVWYGFKADLKDNHYVHIGLSVTIDTILHAGSGNDGTDARCSSGTTYIGLGGSGGSGDNYGLAKQGSSPVRAVDGSRGSNGQTLFYDWSNYAYGGRGASGGSWGGAGGKARCYESGGGQSYRGEHGESASVSIRFWNTK